MTTRMQVTLDPEQHREAARRAAEAGISLAEFIRRLIARELAGEEAPRADVSDLFGIGASGGSHVARHMDEYLGEAISARISPPVP